MAIITNIKPYILHISNPIFRADIQVMGLIPKPKSEAWLETTNITGEVIFASNTPNISEAFDSTYDDDIYLIKTKDLRNIWYEDPNFLHSPPLFMYTYEPIPPSALELIYKGTGNSL